LQLVKIESLLDVKLQVVGGVGAKLEKFDSADQLQN
jgi:hypothetical protein